MKDKKGNQKEKSPNIDRLISVDGKSFFDLKTGEFNLQK